MVSALKARDLDYFAFTLCGGAVTQKAYYKVSGETADVGIGFFDAMQSLGRISCFSFGVDERGREKFDFNIFGEGASKAYASLSEEFPYFDGGRIAALREVLDGLSIEYDDRTVGVKKNGERVESLCVYFKLGAADSEISVIAGVCKKFGFPFVGSYPRGEKSRLYMIALDQSDGNFKLKFYFRFEKGFDNSSLAKCVGSDADRAALKDILSFDGFLHGFQIAYLSGLTSYNFYFKTDETIVL